MSLELQHAIRYYHSNNIGMGQQCGAMHMQHIAAPPAVVWTLVRRFDHPESYKRFIRSCHVVSGGGGVGSIREVRVVSGLPAVMSTERLDEVDDQKRLIRFSIIGGDHRLRNYRSTMTVHEEDGTGGSIVVESYVVDVPSGSTQEDTCIFADTIVKCNLKSLSEVGEMTGRRNRASMSSDG